MAAANLSVTIKRTSLPKCWVSEGQKYTLVARGGKPIRQNLPYVGIQFEQVLKDLGIPYEVTQVPHWKQPGQLYTICSFWNPEFYEVEDLLLPVYRQVQSTKDVFVNTGKMYKAETFTRNMILKAIETQKVVFPAVEAHKIFMQSVKECKRAQRRNAPTNVDSEFLEKVLDSKTATVVYLANAKIDNKIANGDIQVIPAYDSEGNKNGYYGVFDMAKLKNVQSIKLVVPKGVVGKIYGKEKQNLKYWEFCCSREIKIISAKE